MRRAGGVISLAGAAFPNSDIMLSAGLDSESSEKTDVRPVGTDFNFFFFKFGGERQRRR